MTPATSRTPRVGPLDTAPYYATRVFPADVGTCGGVITNEHAQVLNEQDQVIEGLYATGNITATVMGRNYLGAGGSIANTMIFGYVAARHAAGKLSFFGRAVPTRAGDANLCSGVQIGEFTFPYCRVPSSSSMKSLGFLPDSISRRRRS